MLLCQEGHVRRHYLLSGRVQEVGLRYTAFYLAEELGLSGWVSNLEDGRVEMELQGKPETIDLLLCRLDGKGRISITSMEEEEVTLKRESGFCVRG
ncbi:MAG: acylphosphatase [Eubacteriales bacterium]|nr:acylphosphatase [Eubacteriales bacterium]